MNPVYLLFIVDIFLTVSAQLALRLGARRLGGAGLSFDLITEPFRNPFLFLGLVFYGISFFLYFFILSRLELHVVYPIATGSIIVLITLASYFFLREPITSMHLIGIAAILSGIFLVLLPQ